MLYDFLPAMSEVFIYKIQSPQKNTNKNQSCRQPTILLNNQFETKMYEHIKTYPNWATSAA